MRKDIIKCTDVPILRHLKIEITTLQPLQATAVMNIEHVTRLVWQCSNSTGRHCTREVHHCCCLQWLQRCDLYFETPQNRDVCTLGGAALSLTVV